MDDRQRLVIGLIWVAVAVLAIAATEFEGATLSTAAGLFAVGLALWLAVLYLFDPWGILDRYHP